MIAEARKVSEGPFVKGMEAALQSLNVQYQQYNGGAVIGNHVHKSLQVKRNKCNILYIIFIPFQDQHTHTLCSSLIDTALKHTPQLVEKQLLCVRSDQEKGSQHYLLWLKLVDLCVMCVVLMRVIECLCK